MGWCKLILRAAPMICNVQTPIPVLMIPVYQERVKIFRLAVVIITLATELKPATLLPVAYRALRSPAMTIMPATELKRATLLPDAYPEHP